ncbi:MAG: RidA family protein [Cyanobacteria bacterium P01_G01_bin.54]
MEKRWSSGQSWEAQVGYSRVVRIDRHVYVSGTTATDETGALVGIGDPYQQTRQALANIHQALTQVEANLEDVVRTRIYVVNIEDWATIGRAHRSYFGNIRPTTTMVEVQRLINPQMLVEIEAEALTH